jgi:hypothetical protein
MGMCVEQYKVLAVEQPFLLVTTFQNHRRGIWVYVGAPERDLLKIAAILRPAAEAFRLKLGPHVFGGKFVSASSGPPAFESIVCKKLNVSTEGIGSNLIQVLFYVWREFGLTQ